MRAVAAQSRGHSFPYPSLERQKFLVRAGTEKGTVQVVPQVLPTTAVCCTSVLNLVQIFSDAGKETLKSTKVSRTCTLFPLTPLAICKSKVSVVSYSNATRRL